MAIRSAAPSAESPAADPPISHGVLIAIVAGYAAAYIGLALTGHVAFIYKTALIPAFTLYAILSRRPVLFVRAWFPFLASTVLFDAGRGAIYRFALHDHRPIYKGYVIAIERWLTGTPAISLPLQDYFRSPLLDRVAVAIHGAHFVFFLLFGLAVWHARREWFNRYAWTMIGVFYGGLACYFLLPTAPPWLAASEGLIPPIVHVARVVYNSRFPVLLQMFDTNPVAAMPSLHAAFPVACAVLAWKAFGRIVRWGVALYALAVCFAVMYLGEHYLTDVLAGVVLAFAAYWLAGRVRSNGEGLAFWPSLAVSAGLVLLSLVVAGMAQ